MEEASRRSQIEAMEAADEDVSLPWRWILEHLLDMKDVGTPILREMMTYLPSAALQSSFQKRIALRYLEEAIAGDKIDAHVIPLVAVLLEETQAIASYPTQSDYSDILLRVQVEAVITHIRGKLRDWQGFLQALDEIFPEGATEVQRLKKREELLTLMQVDGQEKKRAEVLESYSLTALRRDLLKSITSEKARLERTFLDKLLQDVFSGRYPVSAGSIGQPDSEKEESQEDFHSADGQRHSIGSDDQTVLGGRNSNAESEEDVETNSKQPTVRRKDSIANEVTRNKRAGSQNGTAPTKRANYGHLDLRQRDDHSKAVTSISPVKGTVQSNVRSAPIEEVAEEGEDSLRVEFLEVGSDGHEEFCHKCKEGGSLLCCDGCPIAVHRKCLGFESKSFSKEEWFCPLCTQKRAIEAVKKAREEELAARQRVRQFVANADEELIHEKRRSTPTSSKTKSEKNEAMKPVSDDREDPASGQQDGAKMSFEKLNSKAYAPKRASSHLYGREMKNSSLDAFEDAIDIITKMGRPSRFSNTNGSGQLLEKDLIKGNRSEGVKTADTTCNDAIEEAPPARHSTGGNGITSGRHMNIASSLKAGQLNQVDDGTLQVDIGVHGGDGDGHDGDLEEDSEGRKVGSPKSKMRARPHLRGNRIIPGLRRKRLPWKKEEEDALREGIKKFSRDNGSWGFQWTRLLEYGHGKFHPSRTDVDLKDKWRNLAER